MISRPAGTAAVKTLADTRIVPSAATRSRISPRVLPARHTTDPPKIKTPTPIKPSMSHSRLRDISVSHTPCFKNGLLANSGRWRGLETPRGLGSPPYNKDVSVYDALLVVSFGGPEKHEDVIPYLENVLRGRNVPRERMLAVAEHYYRFDGRSPINDHNRELIAALRAVVGMPVYWGNRNWHPLLPDTVRQMRNDGIRRAIAFTTSAFGSYSGCRQYGENIQRARAEVGEGAPEIAKIRPFSSHPLFIEAMADRVRAALAELPPARLVFT